MNPVPFRRMLSKEISDGEMIVKKSILNDPVDVHSHDFFELVYCEDGNIINEINGKEFKFTKGNFLLLSPMDFHSEKIIERASTIQIHFDAALLDSEFTSRILKTNSVFLYRFDEKSTSQLASLMHLLLDEYNSNNPNKSECILALFRCVMLCFFALPNSQQPETVTILHFKMPLFICTLIFVTIRH